VAGAAEPGLVTPVTGLGIVERFEGMDLAEISAVAARHVIMPVVVRTKISVDTAALVTIQAELLSMAVHAVLAASSGDRNVFPHLVGPVGRGNARALVTVRALFKAHGRELFMRQPDHEALFRSLRWRGRSGPG